MVTANSRAAALGMSELSLRNYWEHQRWGGNRPTVEKEPKCPSAHGSKIVLIKKFNLPNQPLFLHVTQTSIQAFCWKGTRRFCGVQCRVWTELVAPGFFVSHDFTTSLSERVLFPSRWWGTTVSNTGWSLLSWKAQAVPVCESSQHQTPDRDRKTLQDAPARCAQKSFLHQSQQEQSLQLSFLFRRTTKLLALHGHSQGSTFMGSDISEPTWHLTQSFSDGDVTCAFISSKENLLK